MSTMSQIKFAQEKLKNHMARRNSIIAGSDWLEARYALEDQLHQLHLKNFDERMKEIADGRDRMEREYQKSVKLRKKS